MAYIFQLLSDVRNKLLQRLQLVLGEVCLMVLQQLVCLHHQGQDGLLVGHHLIVEFLT